MKKFLAALLSIVMLVLPLCSCAQEQPEPEKAERQFDMIDDEYGVYYEIFVGSYFDADGDGCGDLAGILSKLDYINDCDPGSKTSLHADGVWLMPIMPSPSYHKYDITDYYSVDSDYGTLDDFKALAAECSARGIRLIIDLPINHSSNKHPWFTSACESLAIEPCSQEVCPNEQLCREHNPYCDYYNFSEQRGSGYQPVPGLNGWYYEAQFGAHMPELNLDSEAVREEILNICRFWLDMGIAGFRLDTVTNYYTDSISDTGAFLKWLYSSLKEYKCDVYLVGEAWTGDMEIADYYEMSGIPSLFNFPFSSTGLLLKGVRNGSGKVMSDRIVAWDQTIKSLGAIDAPFLSNHDQARSASTMPGTTQEKQAAAVYLLLPGNPFIYYGEEIAMKGGADNDPNKRAPITWSLTDRTGECQPPEGTTSVREVEAGVEEQLADDNSLLRFYIDAIAVRNTWPQLARGTASASGYASVETPALCAYCVEYDGRALTVMHNLDDEPLTVTLAQGDELLDFLAAGGEAPSADGGVLTMPAYSTAIVGSAQ